MKPEEVEEETRTTLNIKDNPLQHLVHKPCTRCGAVNRHKVKAYCIPCQKRSVNRARWRSFGMDPDAAERALAIHDGRCGICGTERSGGKGWAVDHDHFTGKVRGVLCYRCNTNLGWYDRFEAEIRGYLDAREEIALVSSSTSSGFISVISGFFRNLLDLFVITRASI